MRKIPVVVVAYSSINIKKLGAFTNFFLNQRLNKEIHKTSWPFSQVMYRDRINHRKFEQGEIKAAYH